MMYAIIFKEMVVQNCILLHTPFILTVLFRHMVGKCLQYMQIILCKLIKKITAFIRKILNILRIPHLIFYILTLIKETCVVY